MRDIKGFEGRYAITSCGRVWSYHKNDWLALHTHYKTGYVEVKLFKNYKRYGYLVHRLVLETYNPTEGMEKLDAAHKDDIKSHNYLNNLHWRTHKDNCSEGMRNKKISENNGNKRRVS